MTNNYHHNDVISIDTTTKASTEYSGSTQEECLHKAQEGLGLQSQFYAWLVWKLSELRISGNERQMIWHEHCGKGTQR